MDSDSSPSTPTTCVWGARGPETVKHRVKQPHPETVKHGVVQPCPDTVNHPKNWCISKLRAYKGNRLKYKPFVFSKHHNTDNIIHDLKTVSLSHFEDFTKTKLYILYCDVRHSFWSWHMFGLTRKCISSSPPAEPEKYCSRINILILKKSSPEVTAWNASITRMHSSRMRTARMLPVSDGMHCSGGCTWSQGCTWPQGGVPGPGQWVYLVRGVYLVPGGHLPRYYPPPLWTEPQTPVKI